MSGTASTILALTCLLFSPAADARVVVERDARHEPPCPAEWAVEPCACSGRPGAPTIDCSAVGSEAALRTIFDAEKEGKNFRAVEMHGSSIGALPAKVFGNHNFFLFFLNGNKINKVEADAFHGSEETAEMIRLDDNEMSQLPVESLSTLPHLRVVQLQRNRIAEIPANAFAKMENLLMLNLSDNKIQSLGANAFSNLISLQKLDLTNNQLADEGIAETAFSGLRLASLDLGGNKLSTLKEETFAPLISGGASIDVRGNPLKCADEGLAWLKKLAASSKSLLQNNPC